MKYQITGLLVCGIYKKVWDRNDVRGEMVHPNWLMFYMAIGADFNFPDQTEGEKRLLLSALFMILNTDLDESRWLIISTVVEDNNIVWKAPIVVRTTLQASKNACLLQVYQLLDISLSFFFFFIHYTYIAFLYMFL